MFQDVELLPRSVVSTHYSIEIKTFLLYALRQESRLQVGLFLAKFETQKAIHL